jgi:hypothetical protein
MQNISGLKISREKNWPGQFLRRLGGATVFSADFWPEKLKHERQALPKARS